MATEISTNHPPEECKNCRTRKFCGTGMVECLERRVCQWVMFFGEGRFCMHASEMKYANSTQVGLSTNQSIKPI